jgi:hypothetical protein
MSEKLNIKDLAAELGLPVEEAIQLATTRLTADEYRGKGKNIWLTHEAAETLRLAVDMPPAVPIIYKGYVLKAAPNPRWVYAQIKALDGKRPVAIPARLRGKLVGKTIEIEAITDAKGTTFRYASQRPHA